MRRRRWGAAALGRCSLVGWVAIQLWGCSTPQRPGASAPAIVESDAPAWAPGHGVALSDPPAVDIGGLGSVVDAFRLADGRIVIAESDPAVLHYFGPDGRHLYDAGGPENGPDALRGLALVSHAAGDTVAVYDFTRSELVRFDPNGGRAPTLRIAPALTPRGVNGLLPRGFAPDGRYLLQGDETPYPFPGAPGAILPDSTRLYWLTLHGGLTDSSPRLFEGETFGFDAKSAGGASALLPLARPLAATLHVASGSSGVWGGDATAWEIRHFGPHGQVDRIVRLHRPLAPLTPEFKAAFVARFRARRLGTDARGLDRQFAAKIDAAPFPAQLPAFNDLIVGADSILWLQHSGLLEGEPGDGTLDWTLVGADGHWLGDLTMPPFFRPTAAGKGWVLGVMTSTDGPMRVRLYTLHER